MQHAYTVPIKVRFLVSRQERNMETDKKDYDKKLTCRSSMVELSAFNGKDGGSVPPGRTNIIIYCGVVGYNAINKTLTEVAKLVKASP